MDWRHAYQEHIRAVTAQLRNARRDRLPALKLASRVVEPERLSDSDISSIAHRDAELVIQYAINRHNEEIERNAQK